MSTSLVFRMAPAIMLCVFITLAVPSQAQVLDGVPHLISYQGRLTDTDGDPVTDGEYEVTFTIWSDSTSTAPTDREWISPNCTVLVVNGLFNWQLGSREGLPPWTVTNDVNLWLGLQVESDPEIAPRTRLCSAPYAYKAWQADYAEYADSAGMALSYQPDVRVGTQNGTGSFPVTFSTAFAPSITPRVFATAVLTADDAASGMLKGMSPYAEVSGESNTCFTVTLRRHVGGASMGTASADVHYIAIE